MKKINYQNIIQNVHCTYIALVDPTRPIIFEIEMDENSFTKMKNKLENVFSHTGLYFTFFPITLEFARDKNDILKKQLTIKNYNYIDYFNNMDFDNSRIRSKTLEKLNRIDEKFLNPGVKFLNMTEANPTSNLSISQAISQDREKMNKKNPKALVVSLFTAVDEQFERNIKSNINDLKKYGAIMEMIVEFLLKMFSPTYRRLNEANYAQNDARKLYSAEEPVFRVKEIIEDQFSNKISKHFGTNLMLTKIGQALEKIENDSKTQ